MRNKYFYIKDIGCFGYPHNHSDFVIRVVRLEGPKNATHSARALHPGFAIDLHWESFAGGDGDAAALCQPSTGMTKPRFHLAHVQTVLQADHFYEIVSDVCKHSDHPSFSTTCFIDAPTPNCSRRILALYRGRQIHRIKATCAEFFVRSFFPFAKAMPRVMLTPEVRSSVGERNVQ